MGLWFAYLTVDYCWNFLLNHSIRAQFLFSSCLALKWGVVSFMGGPYMLWVGPGFQWFRVRSPFDMIKTWSMLLVTVLIKLFGFGWLPWFVGEACLDSSLAFVSLGFTLSRPIIVSCISIIPCPRSSPSSNPISYILPCPTLMPWVTLGCQGLLSGLISHMAVAIFWTLQV